MEFWLSDDSTTVDLGDNVKSIKLGGSERAFNVVEFARTNGGFLKGIGNYSPKSFSFTRDDYITTSDEQHAWNSQRNTFIKWFTKPVYKDLYLNMSYSTDSLTLRQLVYPVKIPEDSFDRTWNKNFDRSFELVSPSGIWETTTNTTGSIAMTSTNEQEITITNDGTVECAPIFTFTPTSTGAIFQVKLSEEYGFRLEGTFSSGVELSYNMSNGIFKISDAEVDVTNYITAGSPFLYPITATSVFVTASSGVFGYSFPRRFI
jgi:hypothetical protein